MFWQEWTLSHPCQNFLSVLWMQYPAIGDKCFHLLILGTFRKSSTTFFRENTALFVFFTTLFLSPLLFSGHYWKRNNNASHKNFIWQAIIQEKGWSLGLVDSPPPADIVVTTGNVSLLTRSGLILVNRKGMVLCSCTPQLSPLSGSLSYLLPLLV